MKNNNENIAVKDSGPFSFLRFAITGLWIILVFSLIFFAKIFIVYI